MIHYSGTVETNQHTNEASQDRKSPPTFKINVNRSKVLLSHGSDRRSLQTVSAYEFEYATTFVPQHKGGD